jgi:ABC-type sugar transport system ATPase subunit
VLAVTDIRKTFPGTVALDDVSLQVGAGEVHALLGANGSGKSTLVKVLTGVYQPDAGSIEIGDRRVSSFGSPSEAGALGIAALHQDAPLVDTLTVTECIALFRGYPTRGGRVQWRALRRETAELLARYDLAVDPGTLAGLLSPAERALVGLAIVLDRVREGLRLLILDEVTASLPQDQAESFLARVDTLASEGTPVLMVTHRLEEVGAHAQRVTVLRDGQVVHSGLARDADEKTLVDHIVGARRDTGPSSIAAVPVGEDRKGAPFWGRRHPPANGAALEVDGLRGTLVTGAGFELQAGEIIGVGGRAEGGIAELPLLLSGAMSRSGGTIAVDGRPLPRWATPGDFIRAGLALLPGDRLRNGGIASLSVQENVLLPDARRYWHRRARQTAVLQELIARFDVRPPSADVLFGSLSGGNQQKVLLGKWLLLGPSVMILDDPTSGVDPGARETMFEVLRSAASAGLAVLLFSTELEQLVEMCSRILVLRDGVIERELRDEDLNLPTVTKWCHA